MHKKKILIIAIVASILIIAGIAYGMFATRSSLEPDAVVERFYKNWIAAASIDKNEPFTQNLHGDTTYLTESFGKDAKKALEKGRDAVLCGAVPPVTLAIEDMRINGKQTSANVIVRANETIIRLFLKRDDAGWWRIDEIDCPEVEQVETDPTASSTPTESASTTVQ